MSIYWTKEQVFSTTGVTLIVSLALLGWLNVGAGRVEEIRGTVRSMGMDTAAAYTLPRKIATVETDGGDIVMVDVPATTIVAVGTRVVLTRRARWLTSGHEYRFLRVVK